MRNKYVLITIAIIIAILLFVLGTRFLIGKEDDWICRNGQWVKHGNPSAEMPVEPCK